MTQFSRFDKYTGKLRFIKNLRPPKILRLKKFYGWCKNCLAARQSLKPLREKRKKGKG